MHVARFLLAAVILALVVFAPFPGHTRLFRALHNSAHAPIFGCVAVLVLAWLRSHRTFGAWPPIRRYLTTLAITALLGILTELLQIPAGRDASFYDVRNDMLGAIAFLAVFAAFSGEPMRSAPRPVLLTIAIVAIAVAMFPVLRAIVEQARRDAQFPVVADFERRMDRFYVGEQSASIERSPLPSPWNEAMGEQALRVAFLPGPWPGLNFYELSPDWSGYSTLSLDVTNPTDAVLDLVVRVHDRFHDNRFEDRFNERYEVPARTRTVLRIPLAKIRLAPQGRAMSLEEVAGLIVFRAKETGAKEMYLSKVWLE